ncbi:MAG: aliphatic sulfonate ABC transporter substrate-binding protein [Acuticoccus sp.]
MPYNRIATAAAAAVLVGALAAPALAQDNAPEIDTLSISIGVDLPFLPHIVAKEKGWFKEAGFEDVAFETFMSGNLAGEALLAGEIQLWTPGNLPPISMAHNGIPVVVLGTNAVSHGLEKIVVRSDAGVEKPEDLYNVTLGLFVSSTSGALLGNVAEKYGLDMSKIKTVNLAPPEAMAAMGNNEIQGIVFWEPWPYRAVTEMDGKVVHTGTVSHFADNAGEAVPVSNNRTVWVASQDFVRNNPNATQAIIDVMVKAQNYVKDPANQAEVLTIFSDAQDQPLAMNEALIDNYTFDPTIDEAYVEDMNAVAKFLEATNRISSPMDPLSYTYSAPLKAVDPALVKVEGEWKP